MNDREAIRSVGKSYPGATVHWKGGVWTIMHHGEIVAEHENKRSALHLAATCGRALTPDEDKVLELTKGMSAAEAKIHLVGLLASASLKLEKGHHIKAARRLKVHRNTFTRILPVQFRNPESRGV